MSRHVIRRLRPHLFTRYRHTQWQRRWHSTSSHTSGSEREVTNDYKRRVAQLEEARGALAECYPRLDVKNHTHRTTIPDFRTDYRGLMRPNETRDNYTVVIAGRIQSVRTAGNKLVFLDLKQADRTLQIVCQFDKLEQSHDEWEINEFKKFARTVRKGDWYEINGWPHRSRTGELSVLAKGLPTLLAPSLHQVPDTLEDAETRSRNRHVDMIVNPAAIQTLRVRHLVEQHLNDFFARDGFTKVNTPSSQPAQEAVARPFETEATELEGQKLNLRIAPELWLKRLVVGGMEKVYEIGPAFRNEGVDATHNPEFYTCEFYRSIRDAGGSDEED